MLAGSVKVPALVTKACGVSLAGLVCTNLVKSGVAVWSSTKETLKALLLPRSSISGDHTSGARACGAAVFAAAAAFGVVLFELGYAVRFCVVFWASSICAIASLIQSSPSEARSCANEATGGFSWTGTLPKSLMPLFVTLR